MSTKVLLSAIGACAFAAVVSAQSQSTARTSSQMPNTPITVQGCLERSAGMPSSTAGATGTAGSAQEFVLSRASQAPATPSAAGTAGSSTTGAAGSSATTGTSGSMNIATSYRLDATDSTLTPHVGHKVEITGTVESPSASASSSTSSATASASSEPKLKVETVKMFASTCAAQ
jgi:hypothetical protein